MTLTATPGLTNVWHPPPLQWHDAGSWVIEIDWDGPALNDPRTLDVLLAASMPPGAPGDGFYCTVGDVRAEGITVDQADDSRVVAIIWLVGREIDRRTRRSFGATAKTLLVDGPGGNILMMREPIVSIDQVEILSVDGGATDVTSDAFRIYNRHLSQGLLNPDDRNQPHIDLVADQGTIFAIRWWPLGSQNIRLTGKWGYTDPDGTAEGRVPDLIRRATALLVTDRAIPATDQDAGELSRRRRLIKEKTRDQEYQLAPPTTTTPLGSGGTDIAEVDQILLMYMAPPVIRAV